MHVLLTPFFHIDEKTKMYFLKDITNMLSEKKVSKKSSSKNEHFFRLGTNRATVKGLSEHMLTPEGGGIAERPLTGRDTYNIRRSRTSKMFRLLPSTASCGGLGAKPPEARVQGRLLLLGVGKAHGLSLW